ncbi:hypothetical protein F5B19DRAFT_120096 [Rostrohypoxylon terebratum]|nr:hypothetical protein F5B19DRAFT_120096 [Rostrohypoxylon terebratum]
MARDLFKWTSTRWTLSRCLLFARLLQVSGTIVTAVMNGFLLVYIHVNNLGLTSGMVCLELMVCVAFVYSAVVLLFQHSGAPQRRSSTTIIATFVIGDLVLSGIMIAIVTVLARAGLPTDCYGLTRSNMEKGDAPNDPPKGFGTIRFGNGNMKGVLDRYCGLEQSFYFIAAALIFTYILTITFGTLRIFEQRWSHGPIDPVFTSANDLYQLRHMRSKIHSSNPSRDLGNVELPRVFTPPSRANSPLQTLVSRPSDDIRRGQTFREQAQSQPLPVSPVSATTSPISQVSPISPTTHHRRSFLTANTPGMLDTSMGGLMIDHSAEATITDGYRSRNYLNTMESPPRYMPGQSRGQFMDGHGDESNEMRLSDYVKGETRAQHMKDSGMVPLFTEFPTLR